ncbi:zinc-binding loop region of homing endonuclease-domain-containing protein, partial [Lipomyces chichibuensis]|uniref:zinc-binding loop region of homing endonuclease-domain-containing protein n=1 Tax=Lipomyces chichibuensis TaxID=1546026 RepID=UPI003342F458
MATARAARMFNQLTREKANQIVSSRHYRTTDLGCWEGNSKPDDRGYVHVKLSVGGEARTARVHQVALVADNRRHEVEATLGQSNYDISHLCHNPKCFNPEHLIVESSSNNQRRKICNGQKILVHSGFSYHPCPHGRVEKLRKCILPLHHLEDNAPNANGGEQQSAPASIYPDPDDPPALDVTAGKYDIITPTKAQELLERYRGDTTELGCWLSKLKGDNRKGPIVVLKELPGRPSLKQIVLIATNRRDELKKALGRSSFYTIAALCHNNQCINPEHIIVESKSNKFKRKACIGKKAVVREGDTDHPCPHGRVEKMRTCVLPVVYAVATTKERDESTAQTPDPGLDNEDAT